MLIGFVYFFIGYCVVQCCFKTPWLHLFLTSRLLQLEWFLLLLQSMIPIRKIECSIGFPSAKKTFNESGYQREGKCTEGMRI